MSAEELLEEIRELSKQGRGFKPHKHVALLAVIRLIHDRKILDHCVFFDDAFRACFRRILDEYGVEGDRNRPHTPFFHLSNSAFWRLIPRDGMAEALAHTRTVGSAGELERLVSHAEIEQSVYDLLVLSEGRARVEREIIAQIAAGQASRRASPGRDGSGPDSSLFAHEREAIGSIGAAVRTRALGCVLANLELHDPQSNRYFETDLIIVSTFGIYVVELKHWSGRIEVLPNSCLQNGSFYKPDPHKANGFKAKLVRGLYERQFPHFPRVYVESVVVLTNPECTVEGASIAKTDKNNPTFDSIQRFTDYLKHQRTSGAPLEDSQVRAFADYLQTLHQTGRPRDFAFDGYEVVEQLYHSDERAEVVARPTDLRHRRLSRLRIFFPRTGDTEAEERSSHERATATLNAVEKTGDNPNILRVWRVPNENGYVVEGSDWSESGTLADVIAQSECFSVDDAVSIAAGILQGLEAIHDQSVIHRAVSPENILMVNGIPRLMNFDLSYQLEEDRTTVIPDGSKLKRSAYIAPEVYTGGLLSEAADLFSVGVILFELLSGERPFGCSTDLERTGGELGSAQREKLRRRDEVPESLSDLVFELIQSDPAQRPEQAPEVLVGLRAEADAVARPPGAVNRELPAGERCDLYEIEELVHRGSTAQVYRACGPQSRCTAIKLFNSDAPLDRVVREQDLAASVRHPAVVRVGSPNSWHDGRFYIPFDWVSDDRLRDEIERGARPDLERFRGVSKRLLEAVEALHGPRGDEQQEPVLHNDIKPENILMAESDRPVLIDFGSASHPHVGTYEGTEGYVAPDLRLGEDRSYCEEGDLFGLGVTLFEWFFGERPDDISRQGRTLEDAARGREGLTPSLAEWLMKAVADDSPTRFHAAREMREALEAAIGEQDPSQEDPEAEAPQAEELTVETAEEPPAVGLARLQPEGDRATEANPFVAYLNSLHCRDADSQNALAESQARDPLFGRIQVSHPIADVLEELLLGTERKHVVLTGHAGDGKSTIALELYKRFRGHPAEAPLEADLSQRADLEVGEVQVSLIKDFSEWSLEDRLGLVQEMVAEAGPRLLLISNTGTLLDAFCEYEERAGRDRVTTESELLGTIETMGPREMRFHGAALHVVNLSMADNLGVAERIFDRMIAPARWEHCAGRGCRDQCPILRNVELMQQNQEMVRERLFLAYRRMSEYGTRLTLRQLTAHFAYMITSGLGHEEVVKLSQRAVPSLVTEFMFFNRFFGDNGCEVDELARQLRAVEATRKHGFGARPCPTWERRLWLQSEGLSFGLRASGCDTEFELLRRCGAKLTPEHDVRHTEAREQVRRMVFFLHRFEENDNGAFVKTFLNSPMILSFARWQREPESSLSLQEQTALLRSVMHVLQEHFTGIRLPEGTPSDDHLFITLSRRSHEVRQSAQLVLTSFPRGDFELRLDAKDNGADGTRRELTLASHRGNLPVTLPLALPFLDYVIMRNQGEVGEDLETSYTDRIERFRGQLLRGASQRQRDDIMLVRLRTNHQFQRQIFAVRGDRLEVSDG